MWICATILSKWRLLHHFWFYMFRTGTAKVFLTLAGGKKPKSTLAEGTLAELMLPTLTQLMLIDNSARNYADISSGNVANNLPLEMICRI